MAVARVLLLLPTATYRAEDFLAAAARLGVEVVVGSEHRQALAGTMGERAVVVPFDRPGAAVRAIVDLHARSPLDAVVAVDDRGVEVGARAAERLGLPHNPLEAIAATRDKARFRDALARAGLRQPAYRILAPGDDGGDRATEVGFPCVVKPTTLAASQGVIRADDRLGAVAAVERARSITTAVTGDARPRLLIEAFVPGPEVAVEAMLRAGQLEVLALFDKPDPLDGPYFEETIYLTPSGLAPEAQQEIQGIVGAACTALGLVEGPVHAEVRLHDGRAWPLEVAARSIGGLCARTLRFGTGVALEELILAHALGRPPGDHRQQRGAAGVMMLPIPCRGTLVAVDGIEAALAVPGVEGLDITLALGRTVEPLPEGGRYLGFLFARGDHPARVEQALREAQSRLDVVIVPRRG
jgi:biotin carboxylase